MSKVRNIERVRLEIIQKATQRAKDRANAARWDINIAIFAFAVLIIVIILLSQGVRVEIVAIVAIAGLAMVWLGGWGRGRQLYQRFYDDELSKVEQESKKTVRETIEETIEEKVQKALRERWR